MRTLEDIMEANLYEDCGVSEELFPCQEKCFCKSDAGFLISYQKLCPYCRVSTSLPDGASLRTATIVECERLGYGKRISG
jgi:hypothetical protein